MSQIVIDERQAQIVAQSRGPVEIRDPAGNLLGYVEPIVTSAEIEAARRALASDQPRYTTEEVLRHLESLGRK